MTITAHNPDQRVPCGVCGDVFPVREMASLTDKHNHGWYVCPDCIDLLWKAGRPSLDSPVIPGNLEMVIMRLATFVGSMAVVRDLIAENSDLLAGAESLLRTMDREIAAAR